MDAHASFLIDLEAKKYGDGLKRLEDTTKGTMARMTADMDATTRATERMTRGLRTTQNSLYAVGQASMQIQDIAVQLEGGASAARVFAQQGSQIASIFGPTGMVIGGVVAIGAGIWSWVDAAKQANKEFEEGAKRLHGMEAAQQNARNQFKSNDREIEMLGIDDPITKKHAEERHRHEDNMASIQADFEKTGDAKMRQLREEDEMKRNEAVRNSLFSERSREEHKARMAREKEAAEAKEKRLRNFEQMQKAEIERVTKFEEEKNKRNADLQEKEIKRVSDFERKEAANNEKLQSLQSELDKEKQKAAVDSSAVRGQSILDDISNRKQGISAADIRKSAIREANEERRAIDRQIAKEDRMGNLSGKAREEARERRRGQIAADINAAKNKEELKAKIDGDSIQKLTDAIEKLLAK